MDVEVITLKAKSLISKAKLKDAFVLLENYSREAKLDLIEKKIIVLNKEYSKLRRKKILDLPYSIEEENLIAVSLLNIIDEIKTGNSEQRISISKFWILFYVSKISSISEDRFGIEVNKKSVLTLCLIIFAFSIISGTIIGIFIGLLIIVMNLQSIVEMLLSFTEGDEPATEE
ncbi:MAG: hypothetical protein AAFY76_11170 [Cyanobacteria bacterium J06649_11]